MSSYSVAGSKGGAAILTPYWPRNFFSVSRLFPSKTRIAHWVH